MRTTRRGRKTLGLAMIMKDEIDDFHRIVQNYGSFFDKIYITATVKKTHNLLSKYLADNPSAAKHIELSYFKWIDHFGKARRFNQRQIKTDFWMWIDLDDEIEGAENLAAIVKYMDTKNFEDIWFQYDYIRRVNSSEQGSIHWRDRIIKTDSELEWSDDAVHETVNAKGENEEEQYLSDVIIRHRRTAEQQSTSRERNRHILEKDWERARRPSTAWYLGTTFKENGDYESAIEKLAYAAEHSEGIGLKFLAWLNLCECYLKVGNFDAALAVTTSCIAIDPDHPAPWYQRFEAMKGLGNYDLAMQTAETAMSKKEGKLAILLNHDPTLHYRGKFAVAQAYLSLGDVERAYQLYSEVKKIAPQYVEEQSRWSTSFEQAYDDYKSNT